MYDRQQSTMSLANTVYSAVTKRTSTFMLTSLVGALVFERIITVGVDTFWEERNKGKLWKDIKHKYEK